MISKEVLEAFSDELVKTAKLSRKAKAGLAATGLLGVAAGTRLEQLKDDTLAGRRQRIGQARAMGIDRFANLRT